ncbi:hypothetical protein G6F38_013128 [Rhizopus arrhizus]|nr:hypothetical protein G6F38_013128 [Rhizopus arrhizus]
MMALQGSAGLWWNSQKDELERGTYENAEKAFTAFFGGDAAAQSSALASIDNLKQNKESMVSSGPKLFIKINRVTKENHTQLYCFYRAIDSKLADKAAAKEQSTLREAIDYAVRLERNARERQMGKGLTPKQPIILNNGEEGQESRAQVADLPSAQPMEGIVHGAINMQHTNKNKKMIKGNCYVCGKAGHRAKDCYKRNDHFKGNNNYKNKTHKQNQQQVGSSSQVEEESNEEIEENNLFTHLYKLSSQKIIAQQVPECLLRNSLTEIDYETDPRRFSVAPKVEEQQVSVLVDTSSMISTINEELVEDMALKKDDENEVWIEYGNATKEVARQSVSIHLNIGGNDFVYKLLVVKRQNVPIILETQV